MELNVYESDVRFYLFVECLFILMSFSYLGSGCVVFVVVVVVFINTYNVYIFYIC